MAVVLYQLGLLVSADMMDTVHADYVAAWPNSNTWLKEQVCGKGCSHANGFGQKVSPPCHVHEGLAEAYW